MLYTSEMSRRPSTGYDRWGKWYWDPLAEEEERKDAIIEDVRGQLQKLKKEQLIDLIESERKQPHLGPLGRCQSWLSQAAVPVSSCLCQRF